MRPKLVACYFRGEDSRFARMARVLSYTASQHCQNWDQAIECITPTPMRSALEVPSLVHNTQKMEYWYQAVMASTEGQALALIDADTVILRPLDCVWDEPFDFAYTTKQSRFPFNSGVAFVRVNDRTRAFITAWRNENRRLLAAKGPHKPWRHFFGGINQASLGSLVADFEAYLDASGEPQKRPREVPEVTAALHLRELPCTEWNCEDSAWPTFDPAVVRILHIKSALRRDVFAPTPASPTLKPLVELWRALDVSARQVAA